VERITKIAKAKIEIGRKIGWEGMRKAKTIAPIPRANDYERNGRK